MPSITDFLATDHEHCDALFARVAVVTENGLASAQAAFAKFYQAMLHHHALEESVLFPAFELISGSDLGLTHVMRMEHEQMRELTAQMQHALHSNNLPSYAGLSATMQQLMHQHNLKEEQMIYPLCDRALHDKADALIQRMRVLPQTTA